MLANLASYFFSPIPSGAGAVNTSPHRLQRSFSSSYTVAWTGACPVTRTMTPGVFTPYTFPFRHSGHRSPERSESCATATRSAP
jgi:hypothetical protein